MNKNCWELNDLKVLIPFAPPVFISGIFALTHKMLTVGISEGIGVLMPEYSHEFIYTSTTMLNFYHNSSILFYLIPVGLLIIGGISIKIAFMRSPVFHSLLGSMMTIFYFLYAFSFAIPILKSLPY